ncbi:hypothetical protein TWF192_008980 [Orbilia oligospora]|nr:hypothetical protein TWF191_010605 [Orbilia oligospora]KAF3261047.1 hypothetical protein TWF192_008980 [Orbilia oligospora]
METLNFENTPGILTLPNEILSKIIYEALRPGVQISKSQVAVRLAPVCRRFYDIVIWHLYSHCYIKLQRYWNVDHLGYIVKFRGFGDDIQTGYKIASKRFENYNTHGKHVKILTIRREIKYIGNVDFSYFNLMFQDDGRQLFSQPFTAAFPNLKTITLNDRVDDPLPAECILGSLENILTTLPSLKNLNLHLHIAHSNSQALKKFVESQKYLDEQSPPPATAARLQAVNIDLSVGTQIFRDLGIGNWLLSALPPLLQPSFATITSFAFAVTGRPDPRNLYTDPISTASHKSTSLNPLNRRFHFSNLRCLKFPMRGNNFATLTEFLSSESFENVDEVEIRDAAPVSRQELMSLLTTRFPRLKTINIMKLDVLWKGVNWHLIRDLKQEIYTLKTVTAYTKSSREQIEKDLGPEFMKSMKKLVYERSEFQLNWNVRIPNTHLTLPVYNSSYLKFTHLEKLLYTIDTPLGPRGPEIDRPARDEYLTTGPCTPAFSIQFTELFPNLTTIEFQDAYPESPNRTEPSFNPDYLLPSLVNILSSCYSLKHLKIHLAVDLALPLLTTRKIESMLPMSNSPVKLQTLTLQVRLVQRLYGIRPFHGIWLLDALAYLLPIEGNTLESLDFNVSRKCPTNNWIYAGDAEDIEEYVAVRQVAFVEKHNRLNRRIKLPAIRHLKISAEKESPFVFLAFTNIDRKSLKELDLEDINGKRHSAGADQFKCEIQFIKILLNMFPTIHTLRLNQRGPQYLKLNEYLMPEIASLIMNIKTVILYSVFPANEP